MTGPTPQKILTRNDAIIEAALTHVPFDGWTLKALRAGAEDAGFPADLADIAFPGGGRDAVLHFLDMADRMMVADIEARGGMDNLPIRARIHLAVKLRLDRWTPHKEAIARALGTLSVSAAPSGLSSAYNNVDCMWKAIGDRSIDFSFYTKRASLAAVYGSTLLYWLNDDSEGQNDTWDFLSHRIDDVIRGIQTRQKITNGLGTILSRLPKPPQPGSLPKGFAAPRLDLLFGGKRKKRI